MRPALSMLLGIALVISVSAGALAATVDLGKQSASHIQGACKSAGGGFWVSSGGHEFGCVKKNCDGKGGNCTIFCTGGGNSCEGSTPASIHPKRGKVDLGRVLGRGLVGNRTTNDHRTKKPRRPHTSTSNAPGGVTVRGGAESASSGNAAVRDHRAKPEVRDHRSQPVVRDHRKPPVVLKFP
jgi:hypothetical protein